MIDRIESTAAPDLPAGDGNGGPAAAKAGSDSARLRGGAASIGRRRNRLPVAARLLLLTVLLNLVRYALGPLLESPVTERLFRVMGNHPEYFNTEFGPVDWATSFAYNFGVWLAAVLAFHWMHASFTGGWLVKSLKAWGLMWFAFACVSAVYMNHYSHPKSFYAWNIVDAALMFALLAVANAALYPRIVGGNQGPREQRREQRL